MNPRIKRSRLVGVVLRTFAFRPIAVITPKSKVLKVPRRRVGPSTAQQILADNQVRFQRQTAVPGSEAALRGLIDGVRDGKCINEQAAWLEEECEETMADRHWDRIYVSWGAVQSVKFRHVNDAGQDVYDVRQERGLSEWAIYLDDKGIIQDVTRSDPH